MSTGTVQSLKLVSLPEKLSWEWICWCDQAAQGAQAGVVPKDLLWDGHWWQVVFFGSAAPQLLGWKICLCSLKVESCSSGLWNWSPLVGEGARDFHPGYCLQLNLLSPLPWPHCRLWGSEAIAGVLHQAVADQAHCKRVKWCEHLFSHLSFVPS